MHMAYARSLKGTSLFQTKTRRLKQPFAQGAIVKLMQLSLMEQEDPGSIPASSYIFFSLLSTRITYSEPASVSDNPNRFRLNLSCAALGMKRNI